MVLVYNGERVIPDMMSPQDRVLHEHLARYKWVIARLQGLIAEGWPAPTRIIDAPCGSGYGSRMLADAFPEATVVGLDISPDAIKYAQDRYGKGNIRFAIYNLDNGSIPATDVDVVVCFEGIEHVVAQTKVIESFVKCLKTPSGRMIVSTPRRGGPGAGSPFHTHEMTLTEFAELLSPKMTTARIIGQDLQVGDVPTAGDPRYFIFEGVR